MKEKTMADKKPNVLMICTDHWPGSFLGVNGRTDIKTPTLDYLAANGVNFTNYYSECPVCIPARRSMMTGLSPKTHGDRVYSERMPMPDVKTLAQCFRDDGYQAFAVGKLHVYPQRDRIGFDDVILTEEGRYDFGEVDDYQIWLGEHGYLGKEFLHGMGNNTYYTRPWHLDEQAHPTNWVTLQMMKQIKRKDPKRPAFFYCSYQFPHPPLVPLQPFLDMYDGIPLQPVLSDDWHDGSPIMQYVCEGAGQYSSWERERARKAFFAQCTHIDNQIRLLIGTLRECGLLEDTIIVFLSDHGDMLFDHDMVAKRLFYENATRIPMIFAGNPVLKCRECHAEGKLAVLADFMPTLLDLCRIPVPATVEGIPLFSAQSHPYVYGEVGEGTKATRMIRTDDYKLIYYPCGNVLQLFDMRKDRDERHNLAGDASLEHVLRQLSGLLVKELHGNDLAWVKDGTLVGYPAPPYTKKTDFGLYNQRGYHWPAPKDYQSIGKNA